MLYCFFIVKAIIISVDCIQIPLANGLGWRAIKIHEMNIVILNKDGRSNINK